jgi:hypothetical protein
MIIKPALQGRNQPLDIVAGELDKTGPIDLFNR